MQIITTVNQISPVTQATEYWLRELHWNLSTHSWCITPILAKRKTPNFWFDCMSSLSQIQSSDFCQLTFTRLTFIAQFLLAHAAEDSYFNNFLFFPFYHASACLCMQNAILLWQFHLAHFGIVSQETQLSLTNCTTCLEVSQGHQTSPNMVPFDMLGIVFFILVCYSNFVREIFDFKNAVTLKTGLG